MTELAACGGTTEGMSKDEACSGRALTGESSSRERETDILEDEDGDAAPSSDAVSPENLPEEPILGHDDITRGRIRREIESQNKFVSNGECGSEKPRKETPSPWVAPRTASRGRRRSEETAQGAPQEEANTGGVTQKADFCHTVQSTHHTDASPSQEAEFASLSLDVDDSIEQLNQLILDLDPTFVPVPAACAPLSRSTSVRSGGLSDQGNAHLTGWKRQISDVTDYSSFSTLKTGFHDLGAGPQSIGAYLVGTPSHLPSQFISGGQSDSSECAPPTPAFPVSPATPYVEHISEVSQMRTVGQWAQRSWTQDSRSFLDSANHSGGSIDGELFRSDASVSSASCPRVFGSMCSVSSSGPLPHADGCTPPPMWHQPPSNPSQPSTPIKRSTPNAHSSPRAALKGPAVCPGVRVESDSTDLSSLLTLNGNLEHSLPEAMGDLRVPSLGGDGELAPQLPEKRRAAEGGDLGSCVPSLGGFSSPHSESSLSLSFSPPSPEPFKAFSGTPSPGAEFGSKQDTVKFVQDTSKFWYKPDISRDQAISVLKDKEPGSFIVRDSHSFRGAYGLAMKVATPPPSAVHPSKKGGDPSSELVRHFLIECTQKGVRLKGCPDEPFFGSLTSLVCQHSITSLALPCKLILPDRDPFEEMRDSPVKTATNSAAELLKQGAACNVWYLGSVELESLTGHQAVEKAATVTLTTDPPSAWTVVHFKVSSQGITLTDNQRKLFFRRHYAVNTVIFCSLDPQGRRWTRGNASTAKIFGFVARKSQSETENICHLFAEHDPEQPASAIVNFVSKVMIGSHKK
ncbi:tensin 3-2 [Hippocampus comes]|uniref:tensin 3-2 n=1 Tax=Hippocampus comes TaxID=109280 RepID=UPI00094EF68D|nr:PREDICTED: tensin-3-like [Hippocampus comes]XP_019740600.1 PREDICTED: tensin-3-like [Hippocampus comes]XP_019740608.1 PREDICTED: tensin-3-like [Hippocampus comes]